MAKQDRMYKPAVPFGQPAFVENVGNIYKITGIVLAGNGIVRTIILPGEHEAVRDHKLWIDAVFADDELMTAILNHADNPEYLNPISKAWLRKAQRVISGRIQQKVWARDGFRCMLCGRPMGEVQLSVDHWIPLELGGEDKPSNYISACRKCNKDKGSTPPAEYCKKKHINFHEIQSYLDGHGDRL